MANQLVKIEPIQPPDVRQPARLNRLPQWVEQRRAALKRDEMPDKTGCYRVVPVLPRSLILVGEQRALVEAQARAIGDFLNMTPLENQEHAEATMVAVTKMTMVLAGREAGEFASEAKGEAYMDALDDIPFWAVQEAIRKWNRAEYGDKHDYRWQPAPAVLRNLAQIETYRAKAVMRQLTDMLNAEPAIEYSEERFEGMKAKVAPYLTMKTTEDAA